MFHDTTNSRFGVGGSANANARFTVVGEGTSSNFLYINTCNGIATTLSTGRALAGYIRIYIDSGVSNAGVSAFTAGTKYIAVFS